MTKPIEMVAAVFLQDALTRRENTLEAMLVLYHERYLRGVIATEVLVSSDFERGAGEHTHC